MTRTLRDIARALVKRARRFSRNDHRSLSGLDAHTLADIGLSRFDATVR